MDKWLHYSGRLKKNGSLIGLPLGLNTLLD